MTPGTDARAWRGPGRHGTVAARSLRGRELAAAGAFTEFVQDRPTRPAIVVTTISSRAWAPKTPRPWLGTPAPRTHLCSCRGFRLQDAHGLSPRPGVGWGRIGGSESPALPLGHDRETVSGIALARGALQALDTPRVVLADVKRACPTTLDTRLVVDNRLVHRTRLLHGLLADMPGKNSHGFGRGCGIDCAPQGQTPHNTYKVPVFRRPRQRASAPCRPCAGSTRAWSQSS